MLPIARFFTTVCYLHIFFFVLLSGISNKTKAWYEDLVGAIIAPWTTTTTSDDDDIIKAGIPVWCISMPILVAGLLSVCFTKLTPPRVRVLSRQPSFPSMTAAGTAGTAGMFHHPPTYYYNDDDYYYSSPTTIQRWWNRVLQTVSSSFSCNMNNNNNNNNKGGELNMHATALWFLFLPAVFYTGTNIHRKLMEIRKDNDPNHHTTEYYMMEISNAFGVTATLALALVLVPATKHSVVLQHLLGGLRWNTSPAMAITLHIWLGRMVVAGIVVHGGMYLFSWKYVQGESIVNLLIPPRQCWTLGQYNNSNNNNNNNFEEPVCNNPNTDCSCYHHFRNLTGFLALLGLLILFGSSLQCVRRHLYDALFYRIHMLAAPMVILMAVLHWNRIMLYIAGGVLYYWACSMPVWWEQRQQQQRQHCCWFGKSSSSSATATTAGGVRIVSVGRIPAATAAPTVAVGGHDDDDDDDASIVSLTIEATDTALSRYRSGQYVYLKAPTISAIAHPFSINKTMRSDANNDDDNNNNNLQDNNENKNNKGDRTHDTDDPQQQQRQQLRIIFRVVGPFTRKLEHALLNNLDVTRPLPVFLDGYHGTTHRIEQVLQHDVVAMVAGGIGITPYLSLLQDILDTACLQKVVLHWICRDDALIQYMKRHYFVPLLRMAETSSDILAEEFSIELIIYHTGQQSTFSNRLIVESGDGDTANDEEKKEDEATMEEVLYAPTCGVPFHPSKFAVGTKRTYSANLILVIIYAAITLIGMWIVWYCYQEIQDKHEVATRFWSLAGTFVWATVVSILANLLYQFVLSDNDHLPTLRRRNRQRTASAIMATTGSNEEEHEEQFELAALRQTNATVATDPMTPGVPQNHNNHHDASLSIVHLTERNGRPSISELLECLAPAQLPGLFMCGPMPLMDDLREAIGENRSIWDPRRYLPKQRRIALYEETFHM